MLKAVLWLGLLVLGAWLAYEFLIKGKTPNVRTNLPEKLKSMRIWAKERQFQCDDPVKLVCRLDESYQDEHGELTLSETKSRRWLKVYASDILQLSAEALTVSAQTKRRVSKTAYVRLITPEGNEYREVSLLSNDEVVAAALMFQDLSQGKYPGEKCGRPEICRTCAYKEPCDRMP